MPKPLTLSYVLNRKTDKLLKAYQFRGRGMAIMIPVGAVAGLLWVYFYGKSIFKGSVDYHTGVWLCVCLVGQA
jgi:hypothetical protein